MSGEGEVDFDPTTKGVGAGVGAGIGEDSAGDTTPPPPPPPPTPPTTPEVNRTQPFQPGATSTPYQPSGAASTLYHGGEEVELSKMDPKNTEWAPENAPLLEEFMNEDEKKNTY